MLKTTGIMMFLLLIIAATSNNLQAQSRQVQEVEFMVLGNCGMCKERIEKAAYSVRGVRNAHWDQKKQVLSLTYRTQQTSQEDVERAIAKAGHDTENILTDEKTYANLHHCCVYKRNPEFLKSNKVHNEMK